MGWDKRAMRVEMGLSGKGSAVRFVRDRYPIELVAYRQRKAAVARALVVVNDRDNEGVAGRLAALDDACTAAGVTPRRADERVGVFIPTWCIEAWFAYLDGETVDETHATYPRLPRERECQRHVDALTGMCREGQLRRPAPPSLEAACSEYNERLAAPLL